MATTKEIGGGANDYATPALWCSYLDGLNSLSTEEIGSVYSGTYTGTANFTGFTASASNFARLTTATGQSFADQASSTALYYNASNGATLSVSGNFALFVQVDYTVVEKFQLTGGGGGYSRPVVEVNQLSNVVLQNNIIHCTANVLAVRARSAQIRQNLIVCTGTGDGVAYSFGGVCDSNTIVKPSNVGASGTGISAGYGGAATVNNNAVFNFSTNVSLSAGSATYTGVNGTAPTGGTNVGSLTMSDQFESDVNDFRLKSGAGLIDVGSTANTTDIKGVARSGTDDIGCWEFVSGGGGGTTYSDGYSESVTVDATLANDMTMVATISEPVTLADALANVMTMPNAFTESVTLGDAFSDGNIFNDTLTETISVTDSYTSVMVFANTVSEAVALADAFATVGTFAVSYDEAVALADSYASGGGVSSIWTVVSPAGGTWSAVVPGNTVWTPQ
jgi:hypothetical protein